MPRGIEDVTELPHLATRQALKRTEEATGNADRIGDIAHHEFAWCIAAIEHAVELLAIAARRERHLWRAAFLMHAGADREELDIALHVPQFASHAGNPVRAMLLRFRDQAPLRLMPALANDAG